MAQSFIPNMFNYRDDVFEMEKGFGFYDDVFGITIGPFLTREDAAWSHEEHKMLAKETDAIEQAIRVDEITYLLMAYANSLVVPSY